MPPVRMFWWSAAPNFGDHLSSEIVRHMAGRPVKCVKEERADLFAIGSIMWNVRKAALSRQDRVVHVWGTGCLGPIKLDFLHNVRFHAVRGPVTAGLLNLPSCPQGDAGLLVSDLVQRQPVESQAAVVPHHSTWGNPERLKVVTDAAETAGAKLIDVRSNDSLAVCSEIAKCGYVLSESLHGAIVADSLGIPNEFLFPENIHKFAFLKWHDYCASIGRPWGHFVQVEETAAALRAGPSVDRLPYEETLLATKDGIRSAFPLEALSG